MTRIALTLIVGLFATGCATNIIVRPIDPAEGANGLVYYLPKTFLVVAPKADGTLEAKFEFLPDESNAYAISHSSVMATHTFTPELTKRGFLKSVQWDADSAGVFAEGVAVAQALAKAKLDEVKADKDKKAEEKKGNIKDAEGELDTAMGELKAAKAELTSARDARQVLELTQSRMGAVSALSTHELNAKKEELFELGQQELRLVRELLDPGLSAAGRAQRESELQGVKDRKARLDFEIKLDTESRSEVNKLVGDLASSNTRLERAQRGVLDALDRLTNAVEDLRVLDPTNAKLAEGRALLPGDGFDSLTMNLLQGEPDDWLQVPGALVFEIKEGVHPADLFLLPERRRRVVRLHAVGPSGRYTPQMDFDSRETPPAPPGPPARVDLSVVGTSELVAPLRSTAMLKLDAASKEAGALVALWERLGEETKLKASKKDLAVAKVHYELARERAAKAPLRFSILVTNLAEHKLKIEHMTFTNMATKIKHKLDFIKGQGGVYVVRVRPLERGEPFAAARYALTLDFDGEASVSAASVLVFIQ